MNDVQNFQQLAEGKLLLTAFCSALEKAIDSAQQRLELVRVHHVGMMDDMRQMPCRPPKQRFLTGRRQQHRLMEHGGNGKMRLGIALEPGHQILIQPQTQRARFDKKSRQRHGAHFGGRCCQQADVFQKRARIDDILPCEDTQAVEGVQQCQLRHRTITPPHVDEHPEPQQSQHHRFDTSRIRLDLLLLQQLKDVQNLQQAQARGGIVQQNKQTLQRSQMFLRSE